jgi:hypothetical protein
VGDNYRLVPRSSTRNVSSADAAAGAGIGGSESDAAPAAPPDVLPFDSSHLRTSSKKEKGEANPVFSPFPLNSASALDAPPAPVIEALLREIRKLGISLCVVHYHHSLHVTRHTPHATRHTSHVTRLCFVSYGLDLIRDETDGNF